MLNVNELIGFGAGGSPPATIALTGSFSNFDEDIATATYTDAPIGTAAANRVVWVAVGIRGLSGNSRTIDSITIGGVTATLVATTSSANASAIGYLVVPAGTTATVVVTCSGFTSRNVIYVGTVYPESVTPIDTDSVVTSGTSTARDLTLSAESAGLWVSCWNSTGDTTWTNATELNDITPASGCRVAVAEYETNASGTITGTAANATNNTNTMVAVAWR
jgi:hypothetical protein